MSREARRAYDARPEVKARHAEVMRRYYARNREKIKANVKKWQSENRERYLESQRRRNSTPERKEYLRKWRLANLDRVKATKRRSREKHRELSRASRGAGTRGGKKAPGRRGRRA